LTLQPWLLGAFSVGVGIVAVGAALQ